MQPNELRRVAVAALLVFIGISPVLVGQSPCELPPPHLTKSNLFLAFGNALCTPSTCPADTSVLFTVQALGMDFSCVVYTFQWNFGDGTTLTTSSPTAAHQYNAPGSYNVTVHVSRSDSQVTLARTLLVSAPIPALSTDSLLLLSLSLALAGLLSIRRDIT